jgi:hypothetical protein
MANDERARPLLKRRSGRVEAGLRADWAKVDHANVEVTLPGVARQRIAPEDLEAYWSKQRQE